MAAGSSGAKPSAVTHGLTSRWIFEALRDEVDELARRLAGSVAGEPGVEEAARAAADAILCLQRVRSMKTHALNQADPRLKKLNLEDILRNFNARLKEASGASKARAKKAGSADDLSMFEFLRKTGNVLGRLDEYERRALSRRAKAIRELDYARIEAARRKAR